MGLADSLDALNLGRLWKLVYTKGIRSSGFECNHCHALFTSDHGSCRFCEGELQRVDDVVRRMVERIAQGGGPIEVVQPDLDARFASAGGIGGFLRFQAKNRLAS